MSLQIINDSKIKRTFLFSLRPWAETQPPAQPGMPLPYSACSPATAEAHGRPSCRLGQSPLLPETPPQRRYMMFTCRRCSRPHRRAVPYPTPRRPYPLDPWTRAQVVPMTNCVEIVKNHNEPTLSLILNPNQTVDQSSIWLENIFMTLFCLC
jgi:hypothetical protein